jgi:hypothetical protein
MRGTLYVGCVEVIWVEDIRLAFLEGLEGPVIVGLLAVVLNEECESGGVNEQGLRIEGEEPLPIRKEVGLPSQLFGPVPRCRPFKGDVVGIGALYALSALETNGTHVDKGSANMRPRTRTMISRSMTSSRLPQSPAA